jgi:hypothetical protein
MPEAASAAIRHLCAGTVPKIPDKRLTTLSGMTIGAACTWLGRGALMHPEMPFFLILSLSKDEAVYRRLLHVEKD